MSSIDQILVTKYNTLKATLELLDQSAKTILLMVDATGVLQRTITDGDIRRLLLSGRGLEDTLEHLEIGTNIPVTGTAELTVVQVLALMDEYGVNQIPIVDADNRPVELYLRQDIQPRIQLSIPHMGEYERQYVEEAFETNWIAPLGPNVDAFEMELADYVGSQHAAALSSGTAAIHLALRLLEVGRGDIVICSSFTFVASANPILYQGATPVFIDSEPSTWNMSPIALENALQALREKNKKPKAIIVVHLYGQSADMESIMALSRAFDVPVIEDAAEAMGALYRGKHTGTIGTFGIFSFNGNKIITTSGGGMLISDDGDLIEKARFLSTQARETAPHYEHTEVGYNYRMSNILAGIGRGQLKVLDSRVEARRNIFARYQEGLQEIDCLDWMPQPEENYANRWLSVVSINPGKSDTKPKDLIDALAKYNIEARHVWKPMHQQPLFSGCDYYPHGEYSYCEYIFDTGVCMPSASNMSIEQQQGVIRCVRDYSFAATG